jgi:hypothetical protein
VQVVQPVPVLLVLPLGVSRLQAPLAPSQLLASAKLIWFVMAGDQEAAHCPHRHQTGHRHQHFFLRVPSKIWNPCLYCPRDLAHDRFDYLAVLVVRIPHGVRPKTVFHASSD